MSTERLSHQTKHREKKVNKNKSLIYYWETEAKCTVFIETLTLVPSVSINDKMYILCSF